MISAESAAAGPQAVELAQNGRARRAAPWTEGQDAILNDAAFVEARRIISAWPGYAPTPLVGLPHLAGWLGVAALHYKDESGRFGLGSFKALGGAYAVARVVLRRAGEAGIEVTMDRIVWPAARAR